MDRRQFIINSVLISGVLASIPSIAAAIPGYDLVTLYGGTPVQRLEEGLDALGGLERFIRKNHKVLIKPDIGWNRRPEQGANTNPELLGRLIEMCYKAKASEVHVVDHTHDEWTKCYKNSGIERAAKDAHAKIFPGNEEFLYRKVSIPGAKKLKEVWVHQELFDTDIIINVPALKIDDETGISGSIRNMMGLVWNWDDINLLGPDQCMVDFLHFRKPVLNIVDAHRVITKNCPVGNSDDDVRLFESLILSPDIVTADAMAARLLGVDPRSVNHLILAGQEGLGLLTPDNSRIKNIHLSH